MRKISMALSTMVVLLVVLLVAGIAEAQDDGPTDDEVNAIAKQLFCPVCENVPLDVCPTQACKDWREDIRQKLAAGWSEEQSNNISSNSTVLRFSPHRRLRA